MKDLNVAFEFTHGSKAYCSCSVHSSSMVHLVVAIKHTKIKLLQKCLDPKITENFHANEYVIPCTYKKKD